jgi:hypothetical protein
MVVTVQPELKICGMTDIVSVCCFAVKDIDRKHGTRKKPSMKSRAFRMAGVEGFEPPTQWLTATCSAD